MLADVDMLSLGYLWADWNEQQQAICTKRSCDIIFMKMKVI